ncbi:MFS transporter [Desulfosarcina alkanivorans]|uniref:Lysosomal dipeptide transporter MFSD1 n=1 Tax=Desulfosarcina alkanivorans TaxID=571177 RepID=A0A5K7YSK4_9BACT|nr:MFS transporter [Desulfosarcina alkanivorans]BBO67627.1 MFS transporter [Desulfosarcina alkanivorans]
MTPTTPACHRDPHRWVVFSVICLIYFFVYFHRVSTSVIVSDLLDAFDTTATALGFMSSLYFYIYAFDQPIVGYLADRIGPRHVIACWTLTAAVGCFIFGMAPSIGWASLGRALIGFGVGGVYVPTVKALSQWFREKEFATMVGLLMSVGNFGAVVATTPLAWAAGTWGWRPTFFLIGGITLGMAVLMLAVTHDPPQPERPERTGTDMPASPPPGLGRNVLAIISSLQFWLVAALFFCFYGTAVTLQGLWATPFLMAVLEIDRILASQLNMLIPIGVIIGAPVFGWLPARFSLNKGRVMIAITGVYSLCWLTILLGLDHLGITGHTLIFLVMGLVIGGFISTIWGIIRETTPVERLGLASGILNPAPFLGVAAFQVLTGHIIDRAGRAGELYPISGFKSAFWVCLAAAVVCQVLSLLVKAKPTGVEKHETN